MAQRVRHAVAISAPVEKVFAFLDVPENSLALIPQLVEVKEVTPLPNGGHRLRFVSRRDRRVPARGRRALRARRVSSALSGPHRFGR